MFPPMVMTLPTWLMYLCELSQDLQSNQTGIWQGHTYMSTHFKSPFGPGVKLAGFEVLPVGSYNPHWSINVPPSILDVVSVLQPLRI